MKSISFWFLTTGVVYIIFGMIYGIWMSASGDFSTAPAHGHLNLIGFAMGMLFALYYHHFAEAAGRLRWGHFWLHQAAVVLMFPGILMAIRGGGEGLAKLASVVALLSILLFGWIHLSSGRRAA